MLIRRYGLVDREPATLVELGEKLGISRERVRQFRQEAELLLQEAQRLFKNSGLSCQGKVMTAVQIPVGEIRGLSSPPPSIVS